MNSLPPVSRTVNSGMSNNNNSSSIVKNSNISRNENKSNTSETSRQEINQSSKPPKKINKKNRVSVAKTNNNNNKTSSPKVFVSHGSVLKNDVVASAFANIDLMQCKDTLNEYMIKFSLLEEERDELRKQVLKQQKDSMLVTSHLEDQLKELEAQHHHLQGRYDELEETYIAATSETCLENKYTTLIAEREATIKELCAVNGSLKEELDLVHDYMEQRMEYTRELQGLRSELESKKEEHDTELNTLRFETMNRKVKLLAMEKVMKTEFERKVNEAAEQLVENKYHTLINERDELQKLLSESQYELHQSATKINALTKEKEDLERHNELHQAAYAGVLQQSYSSKQETNNKEERINQLEIRVRELLAEREAYEHSSAFTSYERKIKEMKETITSQSHSLMQLRSEFSKMREYARTIVEQRSRLEDFFNTALEDCHRYKRAMELTSNDYTTTNTNDSKCKKCNNSKLKAIKCNANCSSTLESILPQKESNRWEEGLAVSHYKKTSKLAQNNSDNKRFAKTMSSNVMSSSLEKNQLISNNKDVNKALTTSCICDETLKQSGLYFDDLSWDDKAKVIKALFVFLNSNNNNTMNSNIDANPETID